ncbi:MAG: acetate uptake transporter [Acetobacter sp.]|jgi:succinate-acetate transporter protein|nr:acetate uptake transporter [Acetobacter sp.]MCH4060847.1 acetate uptake transporter [Acetobacter sp.]MCH4087787.1 acetate uptake transporter [Acetobacter sp.]MCI1293696.1 acetate uptake transporter [Acetobacter sp.]MCI1319881.1 acetate uptake transporter [Acetobacter sp.]
MTNYANPGPLGLAGFGMTTILLNMCNAGFLPLNSSVLAMGLVFGGAAQMAAGLLEYPRGNTFGLTAFTSYGAFWISLCMLIFLPKFGLIAATPPAGMAVYLGLWGIFTAFMFVGTLKGPMVLRLVFGLLVILFALLALAEATGIAAITHLAGYEGLVCGALALWLAMAEVLEAQFGRHVLPV